MSKKRKKNNDWEDVVYYSEQNECDMHKRVPRRRAQALARRGMCVSISNSCEMGIIEQVTPEFAMVRTEDGELMKQTWGEITLEDVGPDPAELADPLGPPLGSIIVAGRTWPVRLVRGRVFLEGAAVPGFTDYDSGNVLVSDLASDHQAMRTIGLAFVGLIESWIESNTGMLATFKSPPGIDENELLPDPAPDEECLPADELDTLQADFNAAKEKIDPEEGRKAA